MFQLSDGRLEAEVSAGPSNFRDGAGKWQPIDTKVTGVQRPGFVVGNETNSFRSFFGENPAGLVAVEAPAGGSLVMGVDGAKTAKPVSDGDKVRYAGLLPGVDVAYQVTPTMLKEDIVLAEPVDDPTFNFSLRLNGLRVEERADGSLGLYRGEALAFLMPRPFMYDAADDAGSPYGKAWSPKVTQTATVDGDILRLTLKADAQWLAAKDRKYPVTIDPTIRIAPTPTDGQDVHIDSGAPTTNWNSSWRLTVGTLSSGAKTRALVKFPLTNIPAGTPLSSAKLELYYDQTHTTNANSVVFEARRATAGWDETTATWNSMQANVGELGGSVTKGANTGNLWHSYTVTNVVQSWLNGTNPNYGFVVKAANEAAAGQGGPRYNAAEFQYNGETAVYPRLILTWGRPSAVVKSPTAVYSTGAALSWSAYTDPSTSPNDDLVEYQVHRSVYQTFTPSAATLVAPLPATTSSFTDTTAVPTPADSEDPFGNAYYYMVAVKTQDGQVVPGPTEIVRLPKAGRILKILQGDALDTTLSSTKPTTNLDVIDGRKWLETGNNSPTYGKTRALIKFPSLGTAVPTTAQVVSSELKLWSTETNPGGATNTYDVHKLTRAFDETTATWTKATSTVTWTTPGGDFAASPKVSLTNFSNDPKRRNWNATDVVKGWVTAPSTNHGFLVKMGNETSTAPQERTIFVSNETVEPQLRPQLTVTYLEKTADSTYYAPATPGLLAPGASYTVPLTLSNPTTTTWDTATYAVKYRWKLPDGTDVSNAANQVQTGLPKNIVAGDVAQIAAQVKAPTPPATANRRTEYVLEWDVYNKSTGVPVSQSQAIPPAAQKTAVEEPTSDQLGLESFYQYAGKNTGAGGTVMNNAYAGNSVWQYNALSNPSRGVSTFVRMAYNSLDTSDTVFGYGWSLQASSVMRLGTPLDFHPNPNPTKVTLTDGDGTSHWWTWNATTSQWVSPKGVHLYLQRLVTCGTQTEETRAWVMTRPDRTQFFFDCDGYMTAVVDNNGNELLFTYWQRKSNNKPIKFLSYITDPHNRKTLQVDYYAKGDAYAYYDSSTWARTAATNLTNPAIIDKVKQITDVSGRKLTFVYSDKGLQAEMVDGAGDPKAKTFLFRYDMTQGNKNVKLLEVKDPRGKATKFDYYLPSEGDDSKFHWRLQTITDRLNNNTGFVYADPDGTTGKAIDTTVTDAENHTSTFKMDGFGRPTEVTNAKAQTTKLAWDDDHNVASLTAANNAVMTWKYDPKTGYPTEIKDAEANANGWPATTLTYQTGLGGYTADLATKTSPEGRKWTFAYTSEGDLASVTDPLGSATETAGDYTTSYTYDTWGQMLTSTDANGNMTTFPANSFDPTGYPRTITDALAKSTTFVYDSRGNVIEVTDALGKKTTQTYDVFGRPLEKKVPKDQANNKSITTPAPEYDQNDNVTKMTAPNGAVSEAVFDNADQIAYTLAPKDNATDPERKSSFSYDKVGNLLTATEPKGNLTATAGDYTTTYRYDDIYELTDVTNSKGHKLSYVYDNVGNVSMVIDPRKNATGDTGDFSSWFWYDRDHRVRVVFDAAAKAQITEYDKDGLVTRTRDKAGNWTGITLDARGKPTEVRVPREDVAGTITYSTTRYEYDQVGNKTKVITPRGVATAGVADDFVHETIYDQLNRVKEQLSPYDPGDPRYNTADKTTYMYDDVGRLTKVSAPPSNGQTVRNDTTYSYFDNGWTKTSTDPWGIINTYDYNDLGQQTKNTLTPAGEDPANSPANRLMTWDYFGDGKLKARTNAGIPAGRQVVLVDNSDFNTVTKTGTWATATTPAGYQGYNYQTHAAGAGTDTFDWHLSIPQDGNYDVYVKYPAVTGAATAANFKITHSTGSVDRAVDQTANAGTWVNLGRYAFTRDAGGKVTLTQNAQRVVVADAVKLVRDTTGDPADNESMNFAYRYDPNGNLTTITDTSPNRRVDTYTVGYTDLNQVAKVEEKTGATLKNTTSFTYNENGAPETTTHDKDFAKYEYDVRDLVSKVTNAKTATDPAPKVTTFTYTDKGERLRQTKANGNTVDHTYFLDGLLKTQVEKKSNGTLVSEHTYSYDPNGNKAQDIAKTMNADNNMAYMDTTSAYTYDPRDRIASLTKTGTGAGTETYVHDANNNVISQTVGGETRTFNYDRNRLLTTQVGPWVGGYNYDPYGRLKAVDLFGIVLERKTYDGFDHVLEHQTKNGNVWSTTKYSYDPLDRTATKTSEFGTPKQSTTTLNYLGLSNEVLDEEVAGNVTKSYQYSPWGERLSQVKHNTDGTEEDGYYGYNSHTDVETLTDQTGNTKATYGYTAYGNNDNTRFTGVDKPDAADPTKEPYNPYRFNSKRWDQHSASYDMGFRDYSPGLNRFVTRDSYNGALNDLNLGINPYTSNRYAFGFGNPITSIEYDGHIVLVPGGGTAKAGGCCTPDRDVGDIDRVEKSIQGVALWVRGFLSNECLWTFKCSGGNEDVAQAMSIRYLSGTLYSPGADHLISNEVDWEVSSSRGRPTGSWHVDITREENDTLYISEVRRYRGRATRDAVDSRLTRYERKLQNLGVDVRRDDSYVSGVVDHPTVIGVFRGRPERGGFLNLGKDQDTYVVWASEPGHIYFDKLDTVRNRAKGRGSRYDTDEANMIVDAADQLIENDYQVNGWSGEGSCLVCNLVPPSPVGVPVFVP